MSVADAPVVRDDEVSRQRVAKLQRMSGVLAAVTAVLGAAVLSGHMLELSPLTRVHPELPVMKVNPALCFVLMGGALLVRRARVRVARGLSLTVITLAVLTLVEHATGLSLGVDQLLMNDPLGGAAPGRMAVLTSINFTLLGAAALLLDVPLRFRGLRKSDVLVWVAGVPVLVVLMGYLYDVAALYQSGPSHIMALHTALGFLILGSALMFAEPKISGLLASDGPGGVITRRLLPVVLIAPPLLGYVWLRAERAGVYAIEQGAALFAAASVLLLGALVSATATQLRSADLARRRALRELEQSEEAIAITLHSIGDAVISTDESGAVARMNPVAELLTGWTLADARGRPLSDVFRIFSEETREPVESPVDSVLRDGKTVALANHTILASRDGLERPIADSGAPIRGGDEAIRGVVLVFRDQTQERDQALLLKAGEEALQQAQKMEALGRLAGGVAHDFNNLLSVILTYGDLVRSELPDGSANDDVGEMLKAAQRAKELTHQLLSFSRNQTIEATLVDVNGVLQGMGKMLPRVLGEQVRVVTNTKAEWAEVLGDASRLEQVILNLAINACDAMPDGGTLTLETEDVELDQQYAELRVGVKPGHYVMLAVSDTGEGMDASTQARMFEPFFTTKATGKGTGLGLSIVFGIVQHCGGHLWVYSEVGCGTTIKVFLPRADRDQREARQRTQAQPVASGDETVLLVEDDAQVRRVARMILERAGYRVLVASDGAQGLAICTQHEGEIHLLITDVVMPNMNGPDLARALIERRPGLRVLCMSGYTNDATLHAGLREVGGAFLQKPFSADTLARKVRELLEASD